MVVIGVDCGGTVVRAGRFEGDAPTPVEVVEAATPRVAEDLAPTIARLCEHLGSYRAIGVGVAGLVDHVTGDLLWMPHVGGAAPMGELLREATGKPVAVDNDANVAAFAEATAGSGVGHRMVLMVTVGTGIGGGLVVDGAIERGRGHLGEIGHLPMDAGGPQCACGLSGCWESLASGTALDRAAAQIASAEPSGAVARLAGSESPSGRHLVAAAAEGDGAAGGALSEVAAWFGRGLGALVNVFDPDVIVIGGGVGDVGPPFLDPAVGGMVDAVGGHEVRRATPVVPAEFGPRAGLVGAALLARAAGSGGDGP